MSQKFSFTVSEEHDGQRLDAAITELKYVSSRSQVKNLIESNCVTINGNPVVKAGQKIHHGQAIEITVPATKKLDLTPVNLNLNIIYEDEDIAVLEKPAGISVHPSDTDSEPTIVHGLLFALKNLSQIGGVERPGIVHRIDKGTSGLIVITKTDLAHQQLSQQFKDHTIERRYKALVYGDVSKKGPLGTIETFYGRNPRHRKKMTGKLTSGKKAITHWKVIQSHQRLSLIECRLETGRTHQIRVHLSEFGFSVVGDPLYGSNTGKAKGLESWSAILTKNCLALNHQLLHADLLGFIHPRTKKPLRFESQLPKDFQVVLESIPN